MGSVSPEFRQRLAADALADVAAYYAEVAGYLNHIAGTRFPDRLAVVVEKVRDLRYGENPHQDAAFYRETTHRSGSLADARPAPGRPADLQRPARPRRRLPHRDRLHGADLLHRQAGQPDRPGVRRPARRRLPEGARGRPGQRVRRGRGAQPRGRRRHGRGDRRQRLRGGRRAGVLGAGARDPGREAAPGRCSPCPATPSEGLTDYGIARLDFHRIDGGLLVETRDRSELDRSQLKVVTERRPTLEELTDLLFAWRAVRHVTSNAVVLAHDGALVGVGAGQASRLTAVEIALHKAADRATLAVLASDAYFPFADAIQLAAERGVTAIIQPGGSVRDEMAIEVADRHHMAMVFTGRRHYRH